MDFAQVLNEELRLIGIRRRQVRALSPPPKGSPPGAGTDDGGEPAAGPAPDQPAPPDRPTGPADPAAAAAIPGGVEPDDPQKAARLAALDRHLAGLAISGGGIRSATFALGMLQGLADLKLLSRFDYLSTVSGGGYIGSWLAAWMKRQGDPIAVEKQLAPSRIDEAGVHRAPLPRGRIVDEEPEPIHHLRSYSNYLTPRPGLLSVDTWTVLTIYVRNALINLLLLLPVAMIAVLLGRAIVWCYAQPDAPPALRWWAFGSLAALLFLAFASMGLHVNYILSLRSEGPDDRSGARQGWMGATLRATILAPLVVAAAMACWIFTPSRPMPGAMPGQAAAIDPAELRLPTPMATAEDGARGGPLERIDRLLFDLREEYREARSNISGAIPFTAMAYGLAFGVLALLTHLFGYAIRAVWQLDPDTLARGEGPDRSRWIGVAWMSTAAFIAGFNGGMFFFVVVSMVLWRFADAPHAIATIGPPAALLVVVAATFVEVWLLGRWQGDELREWWARVCAWLVILASAWLVFFGVTLYGSMAVYDLAASLHPAAKHGLTLGWLATAAGGAWAGRRPESRPGQGGGISAVLIKLLVSIAPTVFVLGLLVAVATLVDALVFDSGSAPLPAAAASRVYADRLATMRIDRIGMALAACAVLATVAATMSNVNLFSLNAMYAMRLIRCYLGASRRKGEWGRRGAAWGMGSGGAPTGVAGPPRGANPVTGFDPNDDIPLWKMRIGDGTPVGGAGAADGLAETYLGPHHIINTALNLVAGRELAWQDRKAESFILTPAHCGSAGTGYAPTTQSTGRELTLGRAVSISGAAVDSNIGLHQSSALIALMTTFNARLGWWMRNPNPATWRLQRLPWNAGRTAWDAGSPSLALPLLLELIGMTNEREEYVHLSDGGHFENLAVYELVRRRCRYIVCCDAGTDPGASDDNLANMVRLCRADFGVRIELDTAAMARQADGLSRWHCAVGRIRYDDVDGGERPGIFVYLRTSMTGDEPPDVQQYAATNPSFPWESTLDQFFDEPQFESYRALGFHVAQTAFKEALDDVEDIEPLWSNRDAELEFRRGNQRLFSAIQRRWSPAPSADVPAAQRAIDAWTGLQVALRTDHELVPLSRAIYPELANAAADGPAVPQIHAVAQLIHAMEAAWVDLKQSGFRDLPMNRGWMGVFRRWSTTPALRRLWPVLRGEYRQDFVKFCEDELELGARVDAIVRHQLDAGLIAESMAMLGDEFAREWPDRPPLADLVADAERNWAGWTHEQPISMIIQAPPGDTPVAATPGRIACGIALVTRVAPPDTVHEIPARFELFVWLRRAYRGMGIASRCARKILVGYRAMVPGGLDHPFILQARYPAAPGEDAGTRKEEAEYLLWLNFFGHYDFRCPRGVPPIQGRHWVIERTFRPEELEP